MRSRCEREAKWLVVLYVLLPLLGILIAIVLPGSLRQFDALQEGDRAEVLAELLRRVALGRHDLPNTDDLVSDADQIDSLDDAARCCEAIARADVGSEPGPWFPRLLARASRK